eukprot:TRINITY_DN3698_c0_g1_i2.p1 TRINITY_DN3698_c0_g1~~TRINITY_DN3698_c0_g1_i2.p1  ORF type:complete len:1104 (+),score=240.29 TRINITY_DN3698_c0_g1_i2:119-3430(+)
MTVSAESSREEEEADDLADLRDATDANDATEIPRKATASSFAVLTDPVAGYEAKGGNWNNVADIVRLGILASHKKHDRAKVQFYNLDTRLDGMLDRIHSLQHKMNDRFEELSKAALSSTANKRRSSQQLSTSPNLADQVDQLQDELPVGSLEKIRAAKTFGAAAQTAARMARTAGPAVNMHRRVGMVGSRLDMPPELTTAPDTDSDSSSDRGGLTKEEQQKLLMIAPMDRKLTDAGLKINVLKNKLASMETRLDETLRCVDTFQIKVDDELSFDAIAGIIKKVFSEELHAKIERIAVKVTQVALEPLEEQHASLHGEVVSSSNLLQELRQKLQFAEGRLNILEDEVVNASSSQSSEDEGLLNSSTSRNFDAKTECKEGEKRGPELAGYDASEAELRDLGSAARETLMHASEAQKTGATGFERSELGSVSELAKMKAMPKHVQIVEEPELTRERGTTSVQSDNTPCEAVAATPLKLPGICSVNSQQRDYEQFIGNSQDVLSPVSQTSLNSPTSPRRQHDAISQASLNSPTSPRRQRDAVSQASLNSPTSPCSQYDAVSHASLNTPASPGSQYGHGEDVGSPKASLDALKSKAQRFRKRLKQKHTANMEEVSRFFLERKLSPGFERKTSPGFDRKSSPGQGAGQGLGHDLAELESEQQQRQDDLERDSKQAAALEAIDGLHGRLVGVEEQLSKLPVQLERLSERQPVVQQGLDELRYRWSSLQSEVRKLEAGMQETLDDVNTKMKAGIEAVVEAGKEERARLAYQLSVLFPRLAPQAQRNEQQKEQQNDNKRTGHKPEQQNEQQKDSKRTGHRNIVSDSTSAASVSDARLYALDVRLDNLENAILSKHAGQEQHRRSASPPQARQCHAQIPQARQSSHSPERADMVDSSRKLPGGGTGTAKARLTVARPTLAATYYPEGIDDAAKELPASAVRRHAGAVEVVQEEGFKRTNLQQLLARHETQIRESSQGMFASSVRDGQCQSRTQCHEPEAGHPGLFEWRNGDCGVTEMMPQVLVEDTVASHATMLRQLPPFNRSFPAGGEASCGNVLLMSGSGSSDNAPVQKQNVQTRPDVAKRPKSSGPCRPRTGQTKPADKLPRPSTAGSRR